MRGKKPILETQAALAFLDQHKVSYILLTNGTGTIEAARARALSDTLATPFSEHQIFQSHMPMQTWARNERFRYVMVAGGECD